jgi:hypothetical protein
MVENDAEPEVNTLGLVVLPAGTIDRDFSIADGYRSFSAELLRLALLGIAGVGFLLVRLQPESSDAATASRHVAALTPWVHVALGSFAVCVAAALAHRYCASDSLTCHVVYLRRLLIGRPATDPKVEGERTQRNRMYKRSKWLLVAASVTLTLGAVALAGALASVLGGMSPHG